MEWPNIWLNVISLLCQDLFIYLLLFINFIYLLFEREKKVYSYRINSVKITIPMNFGFFWLSDKANTIYLKSNTAPFSDPNTVLDHQVPVFICDKIALATGEWDITTQQVINVSYNSVFYLIRSNTPAHV